MMLSRHSPGFIGRVTAIALLGAALSAAPSHAADLGRAILACPSVQPGSCPPLERAAGTKGGAQGVAAAVLGAAARAPPPPNLRPPPPRRPPQPRPPPPGGVEV